MEVTLTSEPDLPTALTVTGTHGLGGPPISRTRLVPVQGRSSPGGPPRPGQPVELRLELKGPRRRSRMGQATTGPATSPRVAGRS
jgi:hypothetical protein